MSMVRARWAAVLVICALLAAACGSTLGDVARQGAGSAQDAGLTHDAGVTEGSGAPRVTDPMDLTAPTEVTDGGAAPGSPASRAPSSGSGSGLPGGESGQSPAVAAESAEPLLVGVALTDTAAFAESVGVSVSLTEYYRRTVAALVKAINAEGGVAGRMLEVIEDSIEYTAASWGPEFESACATFTQDNHVHAVILDGVVYQESFNACLTKAGVPSLYLGGGLGGTSVGDATDLRNHPGLVGVNSAIVDRKIQSILNKALAAGFLRSDSKLGIVVEACPYNLRAYDRTLAPIIARANVTVERQDQACGQGSSDHAPGVAQLQGTVLRWRSQNVDSVMFLSLYENGGIYYFAQMAESQGYAPQYLLFGNQGHPEKMAAYPRRQLEQMRGFGGMPTFEVTHPPAPPPAQADARERCLSMVRGQGLVVSDELEEFVVFDVCDGILLLRAALTNTGGETGLARIVTGVEQIGTGFVSALTLNGAIRFGSGRRDGMELTAVSAYRPECSCMAYITPPSPIR